MLSFLLPRLPLPGLSLPSLPLPILPLPTLPTPPKMVAEFTVAEFSGCPVFRCPVYRCPIFRCPITVVQFTIYRHGPVTGSEPVPCFSAPFGYLGDHISPALRQLHWLPVRQRVQFKLAVLVFKVLHGLAPQCLTDDCQLVSAAGRRQLRSSDAVTCVVPRTRTCLAIVRSESSDHVCGTLCRSAFVSLTSPLDISDGL